VTDYGPGAFRSVAGLYTAKGWRVLPIRSGTKLPALGDWPRLATTDPAQLDRWWSNGSGYGLGVATGPESGVFVLDVDDDGGRTKHGDDTLAEILRTVDPLADTPTVLTPSGGRHLYFRWPPGVATLALSAGEWLDIRGAGHQCVAPPSLHPNGNRYVWDVELRPSRVPVAEAPDWLLDLIVERRAHAEEDPLAVVLAAAGWTRTRTDRRGQQYWARPRRPGEQAGDSQATLYPSPDRRLVIWSPSVEGVRISTPYFDPDELARDLGVARPADDRRGSLYIARRADRVTPEKPDWVWPEYLARNIFQVAIGRQGGGKSTFASWLVGRYSAGRPFPGGLPIEPMVCLYLSLEESDGRIVARLSANGAELSQVIVMGRLLADDRPWRLPSGASVIEQAIGDHRARLAIIDGVGYCVEGQQDYPTIAAACSLLAAVAERTGSTVLGLTHPPKGQSDPVTAAIGSTAWTAVPRMTWLIGRDPDDESQRVLRVGKTAFREPEVGVGFVIEGDDLFDVGTVRLTGPSLVPAGALVAGMRDLREQNLRQEVAELLTAWTEDGPIAVEEARHRLAAEGLTVSHPTVRRAARLAGLVTSEPDGKGGPRYFRRLDQTSPGKKDS
jgi:Bifunctional DNA primase/polymerase, N-terminal/AAA domain